MGSGLTRELFDFYGEVLQSLLSQLAKFLGYRIYIDITREEWETLSDYVDKTYGGWKDIVEKGIISGIDAGYRALVAVKEEIVEQCRKNRELMDHLSKIAFNSTKSGVIRSLLSLLVEFLGYRICTRTIPQAWKTLNDYVDKTYGGWKDIVEKGIKSGIDAGYRALEAVKEEIVERCCKSTELMKHLSKISFDSATSVLRSLLSRLAEFLGYQICTHTIPQAWKTLNEYVDKTYGGWKDIVEKGIKSEIDAGYRALVAVKEEIVQQCRKNEELMDHLSKIAVKSATRMVMEVGAKGVTRVAAKKITKQVAAQGMKGVAKFAINPVGIGADVAQAGLEYMGYEKEGKTVGAGGNILAGILIGGTVGGLPGAVIGALGGFSVWFGGEVVGDLVEGAFGDKGHTDENKNKAE